MTNMRYDHHMIYCSVSLQRWLAPLTLPPFETSPRHYAFIGFFLAKQSTRPGTHSLTRTQIHTHKHTHTLTSFDLLVPVTWKREELHCPIKCLFKCINICIYLLGIGYKFGGIIVMGGEKSQVSVSDLLARRALPLWDSLSTALSMGHRISPCEPPSSTFLC